MLVEVTQGGERARRADRILGAPPPHFVALDPEGAEALLPIQPAVDRASAD